MLSSEIDFILINVLENCTFFDICIRKQDIYFRILYLVLKGLLKIQVSWNLRNPGHWFGMGAVKIQKCTFIKVVQMTRALNV